jgi:ATP-dependent DNA helicase PIF1
MTTIEAPEALTEQFLHLSLLEEILPDETTLSDDQSVAISNILDGKNCYVYGPGGTGKTVLLKTAVQRLREEQKKNVAVCATTGIASESIDGVTIHSLAGCGVVENIHFLGLKGKANETRREVIQAYDVLFIDEISMLSGEMFDRLSEHFGIIRQNTTKPFGGLQVVVFGDFLQLQPIPKLRCNSRLKAVCPAMMLDRGLCFQSFTWDMLEFTFCELKKVFRQEDEIFANLLSRVRRGEQRAGNEIVEYVESQRKIGSDDIRRFEMKLFSKNKDVNAFNTLKLNELETEAQIYKAIDSEEPCVDISDNRYNDYCKSLKGNWRHLKEIRAEEIVELKVDCEVMMLLNTSVPGTTASDGEPRRLANGSRGKIIKFDIPDEEAMKSHVEKLEKEKRIPINEISIYLTGSSTGSSALPRRKKGFRMFYSKVSRKRYRYSRWNSRLIPRVWEKRSSSNSNKIGVCDYGTQVARYVVGLLFRRCFECIRSCASLRGTLKMSIGSRFTNRKLELV